MAKINVFFTDISVDFLTGTNFPLKMTNKKYVFGGVVLFFYLCAVKTKIYDESYVYHDQAGCA